MVSKISTDDSDFPPSGMLVKAMDEEGIEFNAIFEDDLWLFPNGGTGNAIIGWEHIH